MQFSNESVARECQAFFHLLPNLHQGAAMLPAGTDLHSGSPCGGAGRQLAPRYVQLGDGLGQRQMCRSQQIRVRECAVPIGCFVLGRCVDASGARAWTIALCLPRVGAGANLPEHAFCGFPRCGFVLKARMFTPECAPGGCASV